MELVNLFNVAEDYVSLASQRLRNVFSNELRYVILQRGRGRKERKRVFLMVFRALNRQRFRAAAVVAATVDSAEWQYSYLYYVFEGSHVVTLSLYHLPHYQ